MEAKIAKSAGLAFAEISAGKLRRYADLHIVQKLTDVSTMALNARDVGRVVKGFTQSLRIIRSFQPDVIFLKGGYVSLPVGLAARILRVPYVIHESDMRSGLTNRILAKHAQAIGVGFPVKLYKDLPQDKLVHTGNPIRAQVLSGHRLEGLAHFKLSPDLPVVLVTGGSQGARAINEAVLDALPEITHHYQVIHIAGERDIEHVRFEVKRMELAHPERYSLHSYLSDDMGLALGAADLVVGRGGANTFAEFALLSKPALVIPHSGLSDQVLNAQVLARQGAIKVLPQERLTKHTLLSQIQQILESDKEQELLSKAIHEYAVPDAATRLAELIMAHALVHEEEPEEETGEEETDG
jgi:UDP-N-acetylglucosamine--N-acetylmuramyl-(pentapeptide) pyrophosphoryl-undecaprenol N-acetylglucosamine transferase